MNHARIATIAALIIAWGLGCKSSDDEGQNNNPVQNGGEGAAGAAGTSAGAGGEGAGGAEAGAGGASDDGAIQQVDRTGLTDVGVTGRLDYSNAGMWACRPDMEPNQCHQDLSATRMEPDGTRVVEMHTRAENPDFDCFYVYPTVLLSGAAQMVDFSDAGIQIVNDALLAQGARFSRICRMFAPLYRQVGLSGGAPVAGSDRMLGLQDVRDAFAHYLEHYNAGRKFVLIGHSQGTAVLTGMIQADIDPEDKASVRERLLSALLIGGSANVPPGQTKGGTFQNLPLCTAPGELGCVIAYVSYASDAKPTATSIFGHTNADGMKTACVNPAVLAGNTGRFKGSYFRKSIANASFAPNTPLPDDLETPFAVYRDLFKGACVEHEDVSYLEFTIEPMGDTDARTPPWRNTAVEGIGFGLHLVDYHIPLEDLIDAVALQAEAARGT
jgi:pimeloyl-ACP methyl ester carboxylesterase